MPSDPIQEIKDKADIAELISEIIPVKRSGSSYLALCPFHNDSKPSMHISPSKGIFKCFACGVGGDVFKFWSEYYQKDFKETVKELAAKYGVELKYSEQSKEDAERFNLEVRMHEVAAKYYHEQLLGSSGALLARTYINKRNFSTATVNQFQLGFSPLDSENWSKLITHLKDKLQVSDEQIVSAGLALKSEKSGRYYDRFRGRLMIPIMDERGRVIGFGARSIPGIDEGHENSPKYINSPDTNIYHKGENLYGINLAKEFIRKEDAVIVVEGYFDLISLHQAGIKNVLANQGTALSPRQARLLAKYSNSKRIYLCFDSDEAGENARDRAFELISQSLDKYDYEVRVLFIPDGKDADDFIQNNSNEVFRELIAKAPLFIDHKIQQAILRTDFGSPQSKVKAIKHLSQYLKYIRNKIELAEYIKIIASKLHIDQANLVAELDLELRDQDKENPYEVRNKAETSPNPKMQKTNGHVIYVEDAVCSIEQEFIILAIYDKTMLEDFFAQEDLTLTNPNHQKILEALVDISFENPYLDDVGAKFSMLSERLLSERETAKELAEIGIKIEKKSYQSNNKERLAEITRRLKEIKIKKQIAFIKDELLKLDDSSQEWEEVAQRKLALEREIQSLKQ